ncbi:MAG: DNA polymerase/3'-5' exonuclease PolX [Verrucomicrobia bacterium]|nr:MAG: DNA polymerase/3'-5' exonuclease PolX [Verrucomicrobiota bacterium]
MTNEDFCDVLENIGRLLELKGENPFKIRAYARASQALASAPLTIATATEEQLKEIDGVGEAIAEKLCELAQNGRLEYYEKLREEFPPNILTLFRVPGLGSKKIKALYDALKVDSFESLENVCRNGELAALPGFGETTARKLLRALEEMRQNASRFLASWALPLAETLLEDLKKMKEVALASSAGSLRRGNELVGDIDFIVAGKPAERIITHFSVHPLVESIIAKGKTKCSVVLKGGIQADLRVVSTQEYPFALVYFTGNKEHNVRLRSRALEKGWSLNEYNFTPTQRLKEPLPQVTKEADVYSALGYHFIPPELREDRGELAIAALRKIPRLVELNQIQGTFHCHTTESDGDATLAQMAAAAINWGWEYLGIADHSKGAVQARGLDEKRLLAQQKAIEKMNAELGEFRLFAGTECDIRRDGSLDFSDEVLSSLDYVVASVHSSFSLPEAEMTKRLIRALSNPYVTMLGHITGRILLARSPYAVDIPAVIDAAAATGTWIELNATPERLDMEWRWWPMACEKGVKCVINPDAHSVKGLQNLSFGIRSARKGGLTHKDVVNCLPLSQLIPALKAKRSR